MKCIDNNLFDAYLDANACSINLLKLKI